MNSGTILKVPPGKFTLLHDELDSPYVGKIGDDVLIMVLEDRIDGEENWFRALLSDGRVGYLCGLGLEVLR